MAARSGPTAPHAYSSRWAAVWAVSAGVSKIAFGRTRAPARPEARAAGRFLSVAKSSASQPLVARHVLRSPLHADRGQLLDRHRAVEPSPRRLADQDRRLEVLREALDARGEVHGVA